MVSTTAVKRALAALAGRTDTATRPYVAVIDEGEAALGDVRRAAGFVDAVGLDRLEEAVDAARNAGDGDAASRGREAIETYRRFRAVASTRNPESTASESASTAESESAAESASTAESESAAPESASTSMATESASTSMATESEPSAAGLPRGDHFHSAPGTPKPDTRQRSGR